MAREAWFHPQLDHPCLVTVYAAWLESGFVVMAVEYCSYGSLYSVLKRRGLFSEQDTVVRVVYPMLQALLYVHSKGFIHRDIKLENVLMTPIHAKLADLGLIINQQVPFSALLVPLRYTWAPCGPGCRGADEMRCRAVLLPDDSPFDVCSACRHSVC